MKRCWLLPATLALLAQAPAPTGPPAALPTPAAPAAPAQPAPPGTPAPEGAPAPPTAPAPEPWQPRPVVVLMALDKVTAHATTLVGRVGETLHFGSLDIVARSCAVRTDDAAAFLEISDPRTGTPPFKGWMVASSPSLNVFEHPLYDVRLVGCRTG